jgi:glycerophosphoryl diester phosphodiesterase
MLIQSHRGAGNLGPENTLESFRLGWRMGFVPEADVRVTKDGVPVAFHDNDFTRLAPDTPAEIRDLSIADVTWDQIRGLDVGSYKGEEFAGQRIPRISDVFDALKRNPDWLLYLDFKNITLADLASLAREHGVISQTILASTVYPHLVEWMELAPESATLHWMGGTEVRLRERINALREAEFKSITQLQIHVDLIAELSADEPFSPSSSFLREVGEELKPRGILFQSLPWKVADVAVYQRLMDLGVESFASDDPQVALEAARTYKGSR